MSAMRRTGDRRDRFQLCRTRSTQTLAETPLKNEVNSMGIDLPLIWAIIIGFGLMMYVIMDGFDLGIGILFPFIHDRHDRDTMVNTIAPVWDGNETWLVLGARGIAGGIPACLFRHPERALSAAGPDAWGVNLARRRV